MKISLIIPYYKKQDYLLLVLKGVENQVYKNFEVIIAEDNNDIQTLEFIEKHKSTFHFPLQVVQQEDNGFQKNKVVNKAILASTGEYVVFIDGDCIPHPKFLAQYALHAKENEIISGRRVMISPKLSQLLLTSKSLKKLTLLNLLITKSTRNEDGLFLPFSFMIKKKKRGLLGSNWGIFKKHLLEINGFDEDYVTAGVGEDVDIEWRLLKNNCTIKSMKHHVVQYHIHHEPNYNQAAVNTGYELLRKKEQAGHFFCKNGLKK